MIMVEVILLLQQLLQTYEFNDSSYFDGKPGNEKLTASVAGISNDPLHETHAGNG